MLGLTMTDIVIMTLGIVSLIIWLMFFIKGMKYNSMFDVLVEKEYPFKEIYGLGYAVLETIKYNYKSKATENFVRNLMYCTAVNIQSIICERFIPNK